MTSAWVDRGDLAVRCDVAELLVITGAAGNIGSMLRPRLAKPGRWLRLLDVRPIPPAEPSERIERIEASITDLDALEAAFAGADAVVHLGGFSEERAWEELVEVNINGTYRVFEAARRQGVGRVVFASSVHAAGFAPRGTGELPDYLFPRPDTNYGVSKVTGEAIGSLYADRYGLSVVCIRIGYCFDHLSGPDVLAIYLSPDDCARLVEAAISAPEPGFKVVWGVSRNTRSVLSLAEARSLGYQPADDSERHVQTLAQPPDDHPPARRLGGGFCGPEFDTARHQARSTTTSER